MLTRQLIPECSHWFFFFLPTPTCGPTGMNDILSTVKSLHSTLYTVWVQVSYRAKLKDGVLFQRLHRQPRVKEHFQRGALIAWCFHPAHRKKTMWWEKKRIARQQSGKEMCRDVQLTFWQQSMNSSMVTTPSLFLSIFCWREEKIMMKRGFLKPLCCDWQWQSGERCQQHTCLKEYFYMLTRRLLFEDGVCAFSHHVVDGLHDV